MSEIIFICGPTCSGKSRLALKFAKRAGGAIVNADSVQLYDSLRILTASPSLADRAGATHLLYNFLALHERYCVARYLNLAAKAISELIARGVLPIVVGGSGLYISSLLSGISPLPEISVSTRQEARNQLRLLGAPALHKELLKIDPTFASKVSASDQYRIARCYEVFLQTGRCMTSFLHSPRVNPLAEYRKSIFMICPSRQELYDACSARFDSMISGGAIEEVGSILGGPMEPYARNIIGFKELSSYLLGEADLHSASNLAKLRTRQYAKRQMTWFSNQLRCTRVHSAAEFDSWIEAYAKHP